MGDQGIRIGKWRFDRRLIGTGVLLGVALVHLIAASNISVTTLIQGSEFLFVSSAIALFVSCFVAVTFFDVRNASTRRMVVLCAFCGAVLALTFPPSLLSQPIDPNEPIPISTSRLSILKVVLTPNFGSLSFAQQVRDTVYVTLGLYVISAVLIAVPSKGKPPDVRANGPEIDALDTLTKLELTPEYRFTVQFLTNAIAETKARANWCCS